MSNQLKRTVIECEGVRALMTEEFVFTGSGQPRASEAKFSELRRAGRNPKLRREKFVRGKWVQA